MVEKNERKSADSNELADYLTTKRIEFSYSTGKLGRGALFAIMSVMSMRPEQIPYGVKDFKRIRLEGRYFWRMRSTGRWP